MSTTVHLNLSSNRRGCRELEIRAVDQLHLCTERGKKDCDQLYFLQHMHYLKKESFLPVFT